MQCARCGASIHEGLHICPHCGARQKRRSTQVTCAHCRYHAPSGSSVCPRCGQVLRARNLPPLILPLAAAVLLAAAFLVVRNSNEGWKPVQQVAQQKLTVAQEHLNDLGGKVLDTASSLADERAPVESPTATQVIVLAETSAGVQAVRVALAAQETPSADLVVAPTTVSTSTAALTSTVPITAQAIALADTQSAAALELASSPTATAQESSPTEEPTQTSLPAPSSTPTSTSAATVATRTQPVLATNKVSTPTPTATPVPPTPTATPLPPTATPTATSVPPTATATLLPPTATPKSKASASATDETTYVVKAGDNWYSIARRYGITQEALAAANGLPPSDILQVDQILLIPSASTAGVRTVPSSPKAASAATQTAAASVVQTYTVQRGDNWFSIARRFGITQEALAAYNGRSPNDILQVNQKLRIPPAGTAVASATPTKAAKPTSTPTPESTPSPESPAVAMLPAPVLLSPMNGDGYNSDALPVLSWQPVPGLGAGDTYRVRVSFTMLYGELGFAEADVTDPSYTVPRWVFDAAQPPDRLSSWSVQVRRVTPAGDRIEISPRSETRTFYWR